MHWRMQRAIQLHLGVAGCMHAYVLCKQPHNRFKAVALTPVGVPPMTRLRVAEAACLMQTLHGRRAMVGCRL